MLQLVCIPYGQGLMPLAPSGGDGIEQASVPGTHTHKPSIYPFPGERPDFNHLQASFLSESDELSLLK